MFKRHRTNKNITSMRFKMFSFQRENLGSSHYNKMVSRQKRSYFVFFLFTRNSNIVTFAMDKL